MPRVKKSSRRPLNRQRMAGVTITVQRSTRPGYAAIAVMRRNGKREREKYFETKEAAEAKAQEWATESGNIGAQAALSFKDSDKRWLHDARQRLAVFGKTPADAVTFYLAHLARCKVSITVSELVDRLLTLKGHEGKSRRYRDDLRSRLKSFSEDFGNRMAAEIATDEISTWLAGLKASPVTISNYRRILGVLFNYAVSLRACEHNPVDAAMKPKVPETDVQILSVAESAALLKGAAAHPEILPAIAIGLFAGVRDAELHRLDWRRVNLESKLIEITAGTAKKASRRLIEIRPALLAWLKQHRQVAGPVWPIGERGRILHEAARRAAGFGKPGTETEDEKKARTKLKPWPHNALRHSFGSYAIAKFQNAPALALGMGNSPAMIFQHYREIVAPTEADAFWNLTPQQVLEGGNITRISSSTAA